MVQFRHTLLQNVHKDTNRNVSIVFQRINLIGYLFFWKKDADVTICILVYVLKQSVPKLDHSHVTICILVYVLEQKS
jgi:hypothetical protein